MPLALGQRLLLRHAFHGSPVFAIAIVVAILLFRFWPVIVSWLERRR
jgi:hypothetical protein